jgi:hypothetical protein
MATSTNTVAVSEFLPRPRTLPTFTHFYPLLRRHLAQFVSAVDTSGYITFTAWQGSGKSLKWLRKTVASKIAPVSADRSSIVALHKAHQRDDTDSVFYQFVTCFFTRLQWVQGRK